MRITRFALPLLLIAAVALPAWAVTIPNVPNGPTTIHSRDRDMGAAYQGTPGTTLTDPAAIKAAQINTVRSAMEGEDSWGIFEVYQINKGMFAGANTIIDDPSGTSYYNGLDSSEHTALVGVFWGGVDTSVTFQNPGVGQVAAFTITTQNVHFELWAVDKSSLVGNMNALATFDPARRTAADRYAGWVDGTGVMLLDGVTTFDQFTGGVDANGQFVGATNMYVDINENGTGLWDPFWGKGQFFTDPTLPVGNKADLIMNWTLQAPGTTGNPATDATFWDTNSNDFGAANVVPEPITMLGMFLAVSGIGAYIRRRQTA